MKNSLVILLFFIAGTAVGFSGVIPEGLIGGGVSHCALYALMFCVGISLGNDTTVLRDLRSMDPRFLLLPLMTIIGTLAGCAIISICLPSRSVFDCLAVGSGFGYYSLSSIFINEYKGTELGKFAIWTGVYLLLNNLILCPWRSHIDGHYPADNRQELRR